MKISYIVLAIFGLVLSGCDILHYRQYSVSGVTVASTDSARLSAVLQGVAHKSGLKASQSASHTNDCLAFYSAGVVTLQATYCHDSVLVQLIGGYGTPSEYRQAKHLLAPALSAEFGSRVSVPGKTP